MRPGVTQIEYEPGMQRLTFQWDAAGEQDVHTAADILARTVRDWVEAEAWLGPVTITVGRVVPDLLHG